MITALVHVGSGLIHDTGNLHVNPINTPRFETSWLSIERAHDIFYRG